MNNNPALPYNCAPITTTIGLDGCVCCVIPVTPQGFTAYREWIAKNPTTGAKVKGKGYGMSLVNQSEANAIALANAQAAANFILAL